MNTAGCTNGNNIGLELGKCCFPVGCGIWDVHIFGDLLGNRKGAASHADNFDTGVSKGFGMALTRKTRSKNKDA